MDLALICQRQTRMPSLPSSNTQSAAPPLKTRPPLIHFSANQGTSLAACRFLHPTSNDHDDHDEENTRTDRDARAPCFDESVAFLLYFPFRHSDQYPPARLYQTPTLLLPVEVISFRALFNVAPPPASPNSKHSNRNVILLRPLLTISDTTRKSKKKN